MPQETLNYWKQLSHVLKYFKVEEEPKHKLPNNFVSGFLEVSRSDISQVAEKTNDSSIVGSQLDSFSSSPPRSLYKCKYQVFSLFPSLLAAPWHLRSPSQFAPKLRAMLSKDFCCLKRGQAGSDSLARVEVVAGDGELVNDDIAELCQVVQALFQHIVDADVVCPDGQPKSFSLALCY